MFKTLLLLLGASAAASLADLGMVKAIDTSAVVSASWETSYSTGLSTSQSASTNLASSQTARIDTTFSLSAADPSFTEPGFYDQDPGRLWVVHRTVYDPSNDTKQCYYDLFESRMSVGGLHPCSHPYNKTLLIGSGSQCDAGFLMPVPEFEIEYILFGKYHDCSYHPNATQVVCGDGHYPCRVEKLVNYAGCSNDTEDPMSGYRGYATIVCDWF
ncbi:hypothetical protein QBC41DRAFT_280184 [Cercophora samala]|uniref:Uncharacterized protein n=1 Tax=Cercophora samala TaxID=330535 RepID=A0AA40D9G7_9PEZI|nr:hypothetical protein QBC41DRAFT_280184 [Cercophora samala]